MPNMSITFEVPLNDLMRSCLRLESLFAGLHQALKQTDAWSTKNALQHILDILQVSDRPDLRTKLLQQLQMHIDALTPLQGQSHVNQSMLVTLLKELSQQAKTLHEQRGKFAQDLRELAFVGHLQLRATTPGGVSQLCDPCYQLWLQQRPKQRHDMLTNWAKALTPLQQIVERILQLLREQPQHNEVIAQRGFYQEALDPKQAFQLIRIQLPLTANVFPEVSVGRHRLAIRLMQLQGDCKPKPFQETISLTLHRCAPMLAKKTQEMPA